MQHEFMRQVKRGGRYEIWYHLQDDTGELVAGNQIRQVGSTALTEQEIDTLLTDTVLPEADEAFAEREITEKLPGIEDGFDDPLTVQLRFADRKELLKRLFRSVMKDPDPRKVLILEGVVAYLEANYTGAQIANYLGVNVATLVRIKARLDAMILIKDDLEADAERVEEI